jgi:hypothetical protein
LSTFITLFQDNVTIDIQNVERHLISPGVPQRGVLRPTLPVTNKTVDIYHKIRNDGYVC